MTLLGRKIYVRYNFEILELILLNLKCLRHVVFYVAVQIYFKCKLKDNLILSV